eukprot:403373912
MEYSQLLEEFEELNANPKAIYEKLSYQVQVKISRFILIFHRQIQETTKCPMSNRRVLLRAQTSKLNRYYEEKRSSQQLTKKNRLE